MGFLGLFQVHDYSYFLFLIISIKHELICENHICKYHP